MRQLVFFIVLAIAVGVKCTRENSLSSAVEGAAQVSNSIVVPEGKIMVITCDTTFIDDTTVIAPPVNDTVVPPPPPPPPLPVEKNIVFFGSSTIVLWNLEAAFPGKPVKKVGYGGKMWTNLINLADTIGKLDPKQVVIYSGDNDLIARRSVAQMTMDIQRLIKRIWELAPDAHVTFLYTKPSDTAFKIKYADGMSGINALEYTNRNINNWGKNNFGNKFSSADTYLPFLLWNPKRLDTKYYQADKLHLTQSTGYPVLNRLVEPLLKD